MGPELFCEELLWDGLLDGDGEVLEADALAEGEAEGEAEGAEEASVSPDVLGLLPVELFEEPIRPS